MMMLMMMMMNQVQINVHAKKKYIFQVESNAFSIDNKYNYSQTTILITHIQLFFLIIYIIDVITHNIIKTL